MKIWLLIIITLGLSIISLMTGVEDIAWQDLFHLTQAQQQIMLISRLPRLLAIVIAGAGISICGMIMQRLTRNRFVSPTTAGTMDAARLGVLVAMMLFPAASMLGKIAVAFVFALAGTFVFIQLLNRIPLKDPVLVPLIGLMFGGVLNAITTFFAYKNNLIQNINTWMQGDFSAVLRGRYEWLYVAIPLFILIYLFANRITLAGLGDSVAVGLGLNYRATVTIGLVIVSLMSTAIILTVGSIPFLGLIVPNIVSLYLGDNLRQTLPLTALLGAAFVLACDILGRVVIYPYEVSISLMVGIIGSVIFLYLLMRRDVSGKA